MKDMTTLLGKYFTNSKTGAICKVAAVDEENRRVTADLDGELKEMALGTLTGGWRKATDEEIEAAAPAQAEPEAQNAPAESQDVPVEPEPAEADTSEPEAKETPVEPMKMSDVVGKLESLFDLLNKAYFDSALPKPVITVQSTPKAYGHCTTKQIWKAESEAMYEINLGAEFLNRPSANTAATMCHEMVHLYCLVNEIADTCQKGRYHNKTFKNEAEARDLQIDYDRTIGYSITAPTDAFKKTLEDNGYALEVLFAREIPKGKASADREKAHKYICPICGQEVKTTAELSLICGTCEVPMGRED